MAQKVDVGRISSLVNMIIGEFDSSLVLLAKINNELTPNLIKRMRELAAVMERATKTLNKLESYLIPQELIKLEVAKPSRPFKVSDANRMLYKRITANADKIEFMKKMHYLMLRIEACENGRKVFEYIERFYKSFKRAVSEGHESHIKHFQEMEKKLHQHIEFVNRILAQLSGAPYKEGGSEYEDMRRFVEDSRRRAKNNYFSDIFISA